MNIVTHKSGMLSRLRRPRQVLLLTALTLASGLSMTFAVSSALATTTSAIAAPADPVAPPEPAAVSAPAPADGAGDLGEGGLDNSAPSGDRFLCVFQTRGDYVHVSSTAFEASGHGWWLNGNCRATWAIVTVQLQEYYSDGKWRNVGTLGTARVRSGGGAGNRATGRAGCFNSSLTGWRSVIDVDLVGQADDPRKLTTPGRNIRCRR